ncbi:hypothetical protein AMTR_s00136p00084340 [Amborella trichopoda]|uniref:Uncharacterized protein n=1 Tax=Amborella trichopoda TaxID=13333 RepID=W1NEZ0_AMBTC|nr:hypothetical protein AMTR_s00136p00084340 [Amborella trichopoda]
MSIKLSFTKSTWKRVCNTIAKWFYDVAMLFNTANREYHAQMISIIANVRPIVKAPTKYELHGLFLDEEVTEGSQFHGDSGTVPWNCGREQGSQSCIYGSKDMKGRTSLISRWLVGRGQCSTQGRCHRSSECKPFVVCWLVVRQMGEEYVIQVLIDHKVNCTSVKLHRCREEVNEEIGMDPVQPRPLISSSKILESSRA